MLIMLFHFKRLPFQMLRLAPNPEKPGDIIMEIYEGDIRKWIASIADSEKRNVAAQTFLKSCIETRNPVFNKLIEEMEHVATHSTAPVLLSGPTGSGKSHLARKIYELRYNKGLVPGSFVEVNCATLQGESVLSNLFGHVRGSFTGATTVRQGLLKTAHEGILFLDEIAEILLQIQVILLKAIEEKKILPLRIGYAGTQRLSAYLRHEPGSCRRSPAGALPPRLVVTHQHVAFPASRTQGTVGGHRAEHQLRT